MIDNNIPLTDEEKEKDSFSTSFLYDDISINTSQPEVTSTQTPSSTSFLYDDTPSSPLVNGQIDEVPTSSLYDDTVYPSQPSNKYSQTEWEAQPEFQRTWNRFANSIGEDDDFYEFMRDADWNLGSAAFRAIESGKWNDQQKQDYLYLKNVYDNTDLEGFGEWLQFTKNASYDLITDPANALALLFAIPTLGTSTAIRAAAGEASKQALKKYTVANIGEATLSSAQKKAAMIEGMKRPAIYGAAEGAVWTGAYDFLSQSTDMNVNPLKTDIDWTQVGISSGIGGTFGGGIGLLAGGISGRKFLQQEFDYFNEAAILADSGTTSKALKNAELKVDDAIDDLSKAPKQKLSERFIASTVGKTTTAFLNLTEASPTLEKYLSYLRYDFDFSLFGKKRAGEKAESFGSANSRRQGNYLFRLDRSLNELKRTGFLAALTKKENDQLYARLLNPKIKKLNGEDITPEVRQAAKDVRPILNEIFEEGKRVGVFTEFQQVLNYVPRRFKWDLVEKNRGMLERVIINNGLADPLTDREIKKGVTASGKEIDVVLLDQKTIDEDAFGPDVAKVWLDFYKDGNLKRAQELKAEAIVTNMLETRWTPFELKTKGNVGDSYGFMKHRPFHAIPDEELLPFLETDNLEKVLQDYIINSSAAITRSEFFGRNLQAFNDNFLQPIRKELMDGGMSANDTQKVLEKITNMHNKITGIDSQVIKNKYLRHASEWGKLSQQMAHLPLATLSSITEPILMMARLDAKDVPYAAGQIGKALAKETVKTIDKTIKGFRRGVLRQEVKGKGKDLTDDEWTELYETGLALEASVMERIDGMYGEAFQGAAAKGMQNFFFKSTLLTQWTSAVQLASFNVGKRLIQSNAKKLADNKSGKKIINRKIQRYYEEQLEDLGLNVNKTLAWYKRSLKNNEFDRNRSNIQNFYKEDIQNAANRFTKEVILNPSTAEANRPLWFSNPSVNFLVQFAGYPTVFNNTIMKRFVNETKNYPTKVAPKILATSMLMTSVALLGNYIRTVGVSGNQERWDNQTVGEKIFEAFRRWGGLAFFDYAQRAESEKERGAGLPTAIGKGVVGPLGQDVFDMIAYRKGFTGVAVDNLPYSAWLPADVKKKMKAGAREIDKAIDDNTLNLFPDEPKQSKKSTRKRRRTPYRKGLEVNIPNAAREPDKAKVRNMNMTYAEMGGILAQDPEDRKGFAEGEEVTYGRASNWLWNALLLGSPYGQMKMWSKILGEADLKKRPRINTIKSKLDEAVSWMDDSFVDPVKEVTSTEWGKKREEARRQEALDQSTFPLNDTDEDEASGWFGIGRKGRQDRRAQRRAERRGARDLETYEEKLAREARDAQRGAEQTQRIQSQSRHRGDAMFKREVEALTGTDSGTEGSRGTRRVMFNEGSLVNVLGNLQTAFDTLSAREKIEVVGLLNQKRKVFAEGTQPLTFNQEYHRDTIAENQVMQNTDGSVTTAKVKGVEYKGKIYNLPSYDRHGGFFTDEELRKKYEIEMETGIIQGYDMQSDKFSQALGNMHLHPANIAVAKEHELMEAEAELARGAINPEYTETPSKGIGRGLKTGMRNLEAGMKALGLSKGGYIGELEKEYGELPFDIKRQFKAELQRRYTPEELQADEYVPHDRGFFNYSYDPNNKLEDTLLTQEQYKREFQQFRKAIPDLSTTQQELGINPLQELMNSGALSEMGKYMLNEMGYFSQKHGQLPDSLREIEADAVELELSKGGRVGYADGTPPKDNSWYLGKKIKDLTPAHAEVYLKKVLFGDREPITEKVFDDNEYKEIAESFKYDIIESLNEDREGDFQKRFFDEQGRLRSNKQLGVYRGPEHWGTTSQGSYEPYVDGRHAMPLELYYTIGSANFNLNKGDYNKEKLTINSDKYDFESYYAGLQRKPGFNLDNIREYYSLLKADDWETAAERFGMERIPDESVVKMWEKEYGVKRDADFAPVNISIPVSDIFTEQEWNNIQGIE